MKNWKYKRLSECSNFISERTSNINIDNYISTENMIENRGGVKIASTLPDVKSTSAYKPNDILLSNIRPYFCKIWFADKKGSCSNDVLVVRAKKEIDPKFLYYVLSDQNFFNWDSITSKGTKMPRGTPNAIMKYSVPDIPLPTQQKIASILSAYDNLIQNYKKQIEALQTAASELYKEWFVRFRFPGYQNAKFENGIPEGWKVERLGNLFEITSSKRVFEEDYVNEGIPFYRSKEIIELSNNQEITTELFISNELYAKFKNKFGVPKENDILITSVGSIGNSYQVRKDDIFYFKDGNLTWIKSSSKKALSKYLIYWLKSDLGKNTLISSTIGTSQSALTIEKLKAIKILVPELNILEKFEQKVSSFDTKIQILNKQIANLTQQRDLLLPRLMSGKLKI